MASPGQNPKALMVFNIAKPNTIHHPTEGNKKIVVKQAALRKAPNECANLMAVSFTSVPGPGMTFSRVLE